ncbi:MAG: DUF2017 family protein [Actinomycetota bacterium]
MPRRFRAPIEAVDRADGVTVWELDLPTEHREAVVHLFGELRQLIREGDPDRPPLIRLFPPTYVDDAEKQAEYRRLMHDDLIRSRIAQLDAAEALIGPDGPDELDEAGVVALLQSVNAVRVVLGTILDVTDDPDDEELDDPGAGAESIRDVDDGLDDSPEHQLYGFLSWLLEWTVRSLSG